MKTLLLVFAVLCLTEARPSRPTGGFFKDVSETRIMYGQEAREGQFPHQLSLVISNGHYHTCGAVLVAADAALTAGHCVNPSNPGNYYVRAGQHTQGQPVSSHNISSIDRHEDYDQVDDTYHNDIAVLYLASPANLSSSLIGTIRISRSDDGDHSGAQCTISGWGTTSTGPNPSHLQYAETTVIDNDECQSLMESEIDADIVDSHICVHNGVSGACSGDDGGPLTCGDAVAGLGSWVVMTADTCSVYFPSVYTRISSFESWIDERIPDLP